MECGKNLELSFNESRLRTLNNQQGTLTGYDCDKCKNKGYVYVLQNVEGYENGLIVAVPCECQNIRASLKLLKDSGLEECVKNYTFDKYKTPTQFYVDLKNNALDYVVNGLNKWFFIGGQSGLGKTMICSAIIYELLKKAIPTRYMVWDTAMTEIKNQMAQNGDFSIKLEEYKRIELLYIDDLLKFEPTNFEKKILFEIINFRYMNNLRTIISSEKTMCELQAIDEAIGSRIFEKCDKYCYSIKKDKSKNWRNRK